MLKQKRFWLGLLISLILAIFVLYQTDPAKILAALQQAQYIYLLPALALYFTGVGVRAMRWHFLLRPIKPIPSRALFPPVVIGYMANDILPARMGEIVRAYILGRQENVSKAATLVTIVVERVFDGLTMLMFIVAGAFALNLADEELNARLRIVGALFIAAIVAFALLAGMPRRVERIAHFFIQRVPSASLRARAGSLTRALLDGLGVLRSPGDSLAVFALSILAWLFETGMYVAIAWGFNIFLPLPIFLVACAVANLATLAPSTPGYIGVFHAAIFYVLATLFGVEPNLATSYAIVLHAALIVPVTLLGFFYLWRAGISLTQMTRA
ncbi:MAG: flippase-like domain-containing protein [Chloroflexi bacterium]|nr:flippase-like domain-containing protein [Chloroflexota bacterium]